MEASRPGRRASLAAQALLAALAWMPVWTHSASAQELDSSTGTARRGPPTGLGFRVRGGALHQFDTTIPGAGSFDVTRTVLEGGIRYAFTPTSFVGLSVGYGWDGYGFSPGLTIGGQAPWSQVQQLRISAPLFFDVGERWRVLGIPILRMRAESTADFGDGVTGGGIVGFSYQFGDHLRIGPGIGVLTEIEGDPTIFPVIVIDWQVTDRLRLETGRALGATEGPGLLATWEILPWLKTSLGFRYEKLRFRLESNQAARGGVAQDSGIPLSAGLSIGYPFATLSVFGGARFAGKLEIDDPEGRPLVERSYDPSPFVGMAFQLLF